MLSYEEIEKYLAYIFSGEKYIEIDGIDLIFKNPTNKIKQAADLVYTKSYNAAVSLGLLPKRELEALLERSGCFTEDDAAKLVLLESRLKAQEILLSKAIKLNAKTERIRTGIDRYKSEIGSLRYKKSSKMAMSAESKAEEDKVSYICSRCTYIGDDNLYWSDYDCMRNDTNISRRGRILYAYSVFLNGLDSSIIRCVARSSTWRIRYIASQKTSDPLFGVPAANYTTDMLQLIYWSNYYQNIYEMMPEDAPPDSMIDDDSALDSFMNAYYEERKKQQESRRASKKFHGSNMSALDKQEVIITRSHELYQDIEYDKPREAQRVKAGRNESKVKETAQKVRK